MLTPLNPAKFMQKIENSGAAYLSKPINGRRLKATLLKALANKEIESASEKSRKLKTGKPAPVSIDKYVLIAEDNTVNQMIAKKQVEGLGYKVHVVADGLEALKAMTKQSFDVILMDCQMPEMDGYEATKKIRLMEGSAKRTPIIALTANALQGEREQCEQAGMDDYLSKPFKNMDLAAKLRQWTDRN